MESSSSPIQRSSNTTPHHHFYSSADQPHSFTNSIISTHSQLSYLDNPHNNGHNDSFGNNVRRTPHLYTPTNVPGHRKTRNRTHSPSVHSSGGGSNIIDSSLSPALLSHHIHHFGDNRIPTSGTNSNSITPPNSNSNTTISCGSGNSTSANIGVPTTPKTTLNHNNNHVKRRTDLENNRNKTNSNAKVKAKKSILEEDDDIEKCEQGVKTWAGPNHDFLPICDALFNVISLIAYFCSIVFDILTAYTWYKLPEETDIFTSAEDENGESQRLQGTWQWAIVAIVFIAFSTLLSQLLSFKWYKESARRGQIGPDGVELEGPPPPCSTSTLVLIHVSLCGVLWRYFKLFIPVDLRFVKNEVRDLCLLRLVHAFCEAAPMLLIQLYLMWTTTGPEAMSDFTVVSTSLSLFSVCWALASFSRKIRKHNVHKLSFTWLGVIFQLLWHLGTVVSRITVLSLYAAVYHCWIFLVLGLHWLCMVLWLISPKNFYHGEKISKFRKITYSALIAVIYTFSYVNVQGTNSKVQVIIYYVINFLENTLLLLSVWLIKQEDEMWYKTQVISLVFGCFAGGILFMCLYYQFFHIRYLRYDATSSSSMLNGGSTVNMNGAIYSSSHEKEPQGLNSLEIGSLNKNNKQKRNGIIPEIGTDLEEGTNIGMMIPNGGSAHDMRKAPERYSKQNGSSNHDRNEIKSDKTGYVGKINHPPGVFNCRFNNFHPMKRKKKKPTTFVPPVHSLRSQASAGNHVQSPNSRQSPSSSKMGLNNTFSQSDHNAAGDGSSGSGRANRSTNNNVDCNDRNLSSDYGTSFDPSGAAVPPGYGVPFWKRPLSITMGSENEGSVGSRFDIQQKLEEKKKKQIAELREIEIEIQEGKLKRPSFGRVRLGQEGPGQPIPGEKKQPYHRGARQPPMMIPNRPPLIIPMNEIILEPQSLNLIYANATFEGSDYYDSPELMYQNDMDQEATGDEMLGKRKNERSSKESIYKSYRIHSDIDSQMSLPRSYTLPREFAYKRKFRKPIKTEQFLPSANSSDGDVDSGEDPEIYSHLDETYPYPVPSIEHVHNNNNNFIMPTASASAPPQPSKKNPIRHTKL